ncbi:hypothetical protein GJAV_G00064850 [Gymnothorax javanicus]|nr:hypothetical protein GJAV_G00064850 [Gymnothorax javanicus]
MGGDKDRKNGRTKGKLSSKNRSGGAPAKSKKPKKYEDDASAEELSVKVQLRKAKEAKTLKTEALESEMEDFVRSTGHVTVKAEPEDIKFVPEKKRKEESSRERVCGGHFRPDDREEEEEGERGG